MSFNIKRILASFKSVWGNDLNRLNKIGAWGIAFGVFISYQYLSGRSKIEVIKPDEIENWNKDVLNKNGDKKVKES